MNLDNEPKVGGPYIVHLTTDFYSRKVRHNTDDGSAWWHEIFIREFKIQIDWDDNYNDDDDDDNYNDRPITFNENNQVTFKV